MPTPPAFLGELAKAEWRRLAPDLHRDGLLSKRFTSAFAAYCQSRGRWIECDRIIAEMGMTFVTEKGYICQRPEVSMSEKAKKAMLEAGSRFGLDPDAHAKLDVPDEPVVDEAADFLFEPLRRRERLEREQREREQREREQREKA